MLHPFTLEGFAWSQLSIPDVEHGAVQHRNRYFRPQCSCQTQCQVKLIFSAYMWSISLHSPHLQSHLNSSIIFASSTIPGTQRSGYDKHVSPFPYLWRWNPSSTIVYGSFTAAKFPLHLPLLASIQIPDPYNFYQHTQPMIYDWDNSWAPPSTLRAW